MKNRNHFIKVIACLFFIIYSISSYGALTVTLTASNHNGYSVSCANGTDGSITSTVSNGTAPYTYRWSTGATTANISSLPSGLYQVTVTDASTATAIAQITLTQPRELNVVLTPSIYGGEYNISCYNCCNGYINSNVSDGVSPYTYLWATSATTANISALCEGTYLVTVTDHNGCTKGVVRTMLQPDRDDWQMTGNAGSTPGSQFIGTSDNKDLVFKTNGTERAKLKANGDFQINRVITNRIVSPDSIISFGDSTIKFATYYNRLYGDNNYLNGGTAIGQEAWVSSHYSTSIGWNVITSSGSDKAIAIGSGWNGTNKLSNSIANSLMIGFNSRNPTLYISPNSSTTNAYATGAVGINTTTIPSGFKLAVNGNIIAEEVHIKKYSNWPPDFVFDKEYNLLSLQDLKEYIEKNHHLPEVPDAKAIVKEGTSLGDMQMLLLKKIEELTLYALKQKEEIDNLKSKVEELKSIH